MFSVVVTVCAMSYFGDVDPYNCIVFADEWGPYPSIEICSVRKELSIDTFEVGNKNPLAFQLLNHPPLIYVNGKCFVTG